MGFRAELRREGERESCSFGSSAYGELSCGESLVSRVWRSALHFVSCLSSSARYCTVIREALPSLLKVSGRYFVPSPCPSSILSAPFLHSFISICSQQLAVCPPASSSTPLSSAISRSAIYSLVLATTSESLPKQTTSSSSSNRAYFIASVIFPLALRQSAALRYGVIDSPCRPSSLMSSISRKITFNGSCDPFESAASLGIDWNVKIRSSSSLISRRRDSLAWPKAVETSHAAHPQRKL